MQEVLFYIGAISSILGILSFFKVDISSFYFFKKNISRDSILLSSLLEEEFSAAIADIKKT
ncbi:hypothetical protein [Aquimarina aggregata]|uniref:hypothetical protein n=1 Tax=Aquimarina aggregata TaxID=1642818 RepID=UPI0024901127|nr:hypothetical protein [Aquimarina aggregata]